LQEAFDVPLVI
jgi:tryptophanyl-tRNA synthetase